MKINYFFIKTPKLWAALAVFLLILLSISSLHAQETTNESIKSADKVISVSESNLGKDAEVPSQVVELNNKDKTPYSSKRLKKLSSLLQKIGQKLKTAQINVPQNTHQENLSHGDTKTLSKAKSQKTHIDVSVRAANVYSEGEEFLFFVLINRRLKLDGVILGKIYNGELFISLRDFSDILELPIDVDENTPGAKGWYIRENKKFFLDINKDSVETDIGDFTIADKAIFDQNDIYVDPLELAKWIDFRIEPDVSTLKVNIVPSQPLPLQERLERKKKKFVRTPKQDPILPLGSKDYQLIDIPFVDVFSVSEYDKDGLSGDSKTSHTANIRTAGDFALGTLTTQTRYSKEDQVTSVRANYKRESPDNDLLGPLKAHKYELGDILPVRLPLAGGIAQEFGAKVTNIDALRTITNPETGISGHTFPGWDVELYRENQLVAVQRVGEDGFYNFQDIQLFKDDNQFKVVFYGPQGEVREEELSIPVDLRRRSEDKGVYDVSISAEKLQTYRRSEIFSDDENAINLFALYEQPLTGSMVGTLGLRSNQDNSQRNTVLHAGLTTGLHGALVNFNAAIDDESQKAAELILRRSFGSHEMSNTARWFETDYDINNNTSATLPGSFSNRFAVLGDVPFGLGSSPRYAFNTDYFKNTDDEEQISAAIGFNTAWKNFNYNNNFTYTSAKGESEDELISSNTLTGTFGKNRVRLTSQYEHKPDRSLRQLLMNYNYRMNKELEFDFDVEKSLLNNVTEGSAQVNWQTGLARFSPIVKYNTDKDFFAGINTRFGLVIDKQAPDIYFFNRPLTSNGGISAFVFLDQNANGKHDEGEPPIEGVWVRSLQNGGRQETNKDGVALFTRVRELKLTDVYVEEESLEDPFWIPGFEGISFLPREGYVAEVDFPILMTGEIDGTLYKKLKNGQLDPQRSVVLHLYDKEGKIQQTTYTDMSGFYFFSKVPPGKYILDISEKSAARKKFVRSVPQLITIGADGTTLYGHDLFVEDGESDIPSKVMEGPRAYHYVLNLGEFHSRLRMSLHWFKLHRKYSELLYGGDILLPKINRQKAGSSSQDKETSKERTAQNNRSSYTKTSKDDAKANDKKKKPTHILRLGLREDNIQKAYEKCRLFMERKLSCKVEIYPAERHEYIVPDILGPDISKNVSYKDKELSSQKHTSHKHNG